jgi:hypothetical protein
MCDFTVNVMFMNLEKVFFTIKSNDHSNGAGAGAGDNVAFGATEAHKK